MVFAAGVAAACGVDERAVAVAGSESPANGNTPDGGRQEEGTPSDCTPAARDCSSPFDNDCDGSPDDTLDEACRCVPGNTMACDVPPEGSVGSCRAGTSECVVDASGGRSDWSSCVGARPAQPRNCNSSEDNDCNGHTDSDECDCVPGETRACVEAPGSFGCTLGTETCVAGVGGQSSWGPCVFVPEVDGVPCNDGNPRTVGDACLAGSCESRRDDLLAVGDAFTCAVTRAGALACWGNLTASEAGGESPSPFTLAEAGFVGVSAGGGTACALREDRTVACFLDNLFGERGNGAPSVVTAYSQLSDVVSLDGALYLSSGFRNHAALDGAGLVWVWGEGQQAANIELYGPVAPTIVLGPVASYETVPQPHRVRSLGNVALVSVGTFHACALRGNGSVACWGRSVFGDLGVPGVTASAAPVEVAGLGEVTQLGSGFGTCAVETSGIVQCWGIACPGGVFDAFCAAPTEVPGITDAIQVVTSGSSTCVLQRSGQVACWGRNDLGQLGDGTTVDRTAPGPVTGLTDAVLLARGGRNAHNCALRRNGEVVCWGYDVAGQVGDGSTTNRLTPIAVSGLGLVGPER